MRKKLIGLLMMLTSSLVCAAQSDNTRKPPVPTFATVEILLDAPGMNLPESRWEINYEMRLVTLEREISALKHKEPEPIGDLIKQGTIKNSLTAADGRKVTINFPLDVEMQSRLRNEPPPLTAPTITSEESREYERRAQTFAFRAVAEIYVAGLGGKLVLPLVGSWPYATFHEARFVIKIIIKANRDYSVAYPKPPQASRREIIQHE